MNVCLISREFPPFVGGGIGTYTRQLAFALAHHGHRPVAVTVSDDGGEHREERSGVTVVRLPFIGGSDWSRPHPSISTPEALAAFRAFVPESVFALQVARALPRLVEEFSIDAIEAPDTGAPAWFALNDRRTGGAWPSGVARPPLVTVIHSPTRWIASSNGTLPLSAKEAALARMEGEQALWSDALTSPSAAMARWAEREWRLSAESVAVTPNPLGELEFDARCAGDFSPDTPPGSPIRILFVGRLEPRKGVETLIAAFSMLTDGELHLVGEDTPEPGTGRPFGASLIERFVGPAARIRIHGSLDPDRLAIVRRTAPIAVVPSPGDNFPYTCVEAMAAGQVVVAARAGGLAELIREGTDGLLFTPGDPEACASALRAAIAMSPSDRESRGRSAAQRVLTICGNERIVGDRIEHYERAAIHAHAPQHAPTPADLVCLNGVGAPEHALRRLAEGARQPGIDFTHGWTRIGDGPVLAFGTPCTESLTGTPRPLGPMMVRRAALDDPRVRAASPVQTVEGTPPWSHARVPATWSAASALSGAGCSGAVVPECVFELPRRAGAPPVGVVRGLLRRVGP